MGNEGIWELIVSFGVGCFFSFGVGKAKIQKQAGSYKNTWEHSISFHYEYASNSISNHQLLQHLSFPNYSFLTVPISMTASFSPFQTQPTNRRIQYCMQIYRVLDKKNIEGEQFYQIHWKGKHRLAWSWHPKAEIAKECPHSLAQLDNYDRRFSMKCEQVRISSSNPPSKTSGNRNRKVKQENNQENNMENENEAGSSMINERRMKGKMVLRQGSDFILSKAKELMIKEEANVSISSQQLKIFIFTQTKNESYWVYSDSVKEIYGKKPQSTTYSVLWSDGNKGEVSEYDLIERESTKLCEFWEQKLGLFPNKKVEL